MIVINRKFNLDVDYLGATFTFRVKHMNAIESRRFQLALSGWRDVIVTNGEAKPIDWDHESHDSTIEALWEAFPTFVLSMKCDALKEEIDGELHDVEIPKDPQEIADFLKSIHGGDDVLVSLAWAYQAAVADAAKKAEKQPAA